jgi:phosphohistidine phosphatase
VKQRQLILMRHATANPGDGRDHARELSDRGKDEAQRVGCWLAAEGRVPGRVLCSSALRCRETWQALAVGLGRDVAIEFEDRLYNAPSEVLLDSLTDLTDLRETFSDAGDSEGEIVLLIAHNPGVSHLALDLATETLDTTSMPSSAHSRMRSGFAPASTACFEIASSWSMLRRSAAHLICFSTAIDL